VPFYVSEGIVMSFDEHLKAKADENWECVGLLKTYLPRRFNVAASRLYYSIFLIVKSRMVANAKDASKPEASKMSAGAATNSHRLVSQYIKTFDDSVYDLFRDLHDLRNEADYEPRPVCREDFEEAYEFWSKWRTRFLSEY
jgi:hypothetical protein